MVDLHQTLRFRSEDEREVLTVVRIRERACQHLAAACVGLQFQLRQVTTQDVVAGIAAVTVRVRPSMSGQVSVVEHLALAIDNSQSVESDKVGDNPVTAACSARESSVRHLPSCTP